MQELTNLLQRVNKNKVIKQRLYKNKEVSRLPKDAEPFKIECLVGGYYQVFLRAGKWGLLTLYMGGGSESEPIFKVEHDFCDTESAIFYAMYAYTREDIGT